MQSQLIWFGLVLCTSLDCRRLQAVDGIAHYFPHPLRRRRFVAENVTVVNHGYYLVIGTLKTVCSQISLRCLLDLLMFTNKYSNLNDGVG